MLRLARALRPYRETGSLNEHVKAIPPNYRSKNQRLSFSQIGLSLRAEANSFPPIGWHSFRHSVSAWGKEAGLELEDVKTLLRHEDIATTSNVYGELGMDAKRRIQEKLVEFVRRQASQEASKQEALWQPNPSVTIQ